MNGLGREELLASGKRAVYRGDCDDVLIAPDHTGGDNYHNCLGRRRHPAQQLHGCGCGYSWNSGGAILRDPFPPKEGKPGG